MKNKSNPQYLTRSRVLFLFSLSSMRTLLSKLLKQNILINKSFKILLILFFIFFGKGFGGDNDFGSVWGQQSPSNGSLSLSFGKNSFNNSKPSNVIQNNSSGNSLPRQQNVPLMSYRQADETTPAATPNQPSSGFVSPGSSSSYAPANPSGSDQSSPTLGSPNEMSPAVPPASPSPVENLPNATENSGNSAGKSSKESDNDKIFAPYIRKPVSEMITGLDCHLEELLKGAYSTQDRYNRIHAYWTLTEKLATYNIYVKQLQDIRECLNRYANLESIPPNIRPLLVTTQILAQQKQKEAEIDFIIEQYHFIAQYQRDRTYLNVNQLNDPLSASKSEQIKAILPIPASLPSLSPYQTRFEEMSKTRRLSQTAQKLNLIIPLQYQVLNSRLNEVNQSFACLKSLFVDKEAKEEQLFNALEKNTQAKLKFIQAVFTYNRMIAAYVSETVGNSVQGERYFSTLNLPYLTPTQIKEKTVSPINSEIKTEIGQNQRRQTFRPVIPQTFVSKESIIRGQSPVDPNQPATPSPPNPNETQNPAENPPLPSAPNPASNVPAIPNINSPSISAESITDSNPIVEGSDSSNREVPEEVRRQIKDISAALFPTLTTQSGAGDSPIIEISLTLSEAVSQSWESRQRYEIVEAYWKLRTTLSELEIEKAIEAKGHQTLLDLDQKQKQSQSPLTPELENLMRVYLVFLNDCAARIASLKIAVRNEQIELMSKMNRATENGWPIPTTIPFSGPTYNLETEQNMRRTNFVLLTESVLIPEKMKAIEEFSMKMGAKENLLQPEITTFANNEDAIIYLKILDNKRSMAFSFIQMVESLNLSVARYVSDYSDSFIPNNIFIKSLIGNENE